MYDGSTGTGEAVLMAHRVTAAQGGSVGRSASPLCRRGPDPVDDGERRARLRSPPDVTAAEDLLAASTTASPASSCRPRCSRQCTRPESRRREGASAWRAAHCGVHRSRVARLAGISRRHGGRYRRRRRAVHRQCAEFRRPVCGPFRDAIEIRSPDAGPPLRRDRRRRRRSRIRADPLDARAAYPPRQGDVEYLHQFRPVLPRLHHPHDASSAKPASGASPASTTPTP